MCAVYRLLYRCQPKSFVFPATTITLRRGSKEIWRGSKEIWRGSKEIYDPALGYNYNIKKQRTA